MITLETNGKRYEGFTTVNVRRSFPEIAGAFSFNAVSSRAMRFPVELGDTCKVYANGVAIINGYIEKLSISYSNNEHTISIEGRDKTCDIIDSTLNSKAIYNPPITLKKVIENSILKLGISGMNVVQKVDIKPFNSSEIQSGKIGSTYFSFIDKLAKLRQVILTTDGQGNIVIDRSSQRRIKTVLLSQYGNNQSNILSSSSTFDNTKRFSVYRSYSQGNPLGSIDDPQTPSQLSNRLGTTAFDKQIRPTRQYNFITDSSSSDANLKNRAAWEANIRRAQSRIFNCTVKGFVATNDNIIWQPNLLVEVSDEFSNTQGLFLIKDVTYRISTGGEFTDLALVTKDAFTLQAEQDARDAKVNKQGVNYIDLKAGETY